MRWSSIGYTSPCQTGSTSPCSRAQKARAAVSPPPALAPEIARCDATREGNSQDYETTTMVAQCVTGDVTHTLRAEGFDASEDGTGRGQPIIAFGGQMSVPQYDVDLSQTLQAKNPQAVEIGSAVRRLTPRECERLMGLSDDFTQIPYRGKPAADGPRYKVCGNSQARNMMRWIAHGLRDAMSARSKDIAA